MPRWPSFSREFKERLAARYAAGESAYTMGPEIGVRSDTVLRWVGEVGVAIRTKKQARRLRVVPIIDRFRSKYDVLVDGCWQWTGSVNADGYGLFRYGGAILRAHQFSYEQFIGEMPEGLEVDHLCRNRGCVNPEHLEAVTHAENIARGRNHNSHKTQCKRGHPLSGGNLFIRQGKRQCRECSNARQRRVYWEKKGVAL